MAERFDLPTMLAVLKNRQQQRTEENTIQAMADYEAALDKKKKQDAEDQALLQKLADHMQRTDEEKNSDIQKAWYNFAEQLH